MKYLLALYLVIFQVFLCNCQRNSKRSLKVQYKWRQLDFNYPSDQDRSNAIRNETFIPGNGFPIDTDVYYSDTGERKVFITIPRYSPGIPAALSTVSNKSIDGNPLLTPYPNLKWNQNHEGCPKDRILSVFRVQVDKCKRLWVLDTGVVEGVQKCPPQLSAFDLTTDKVLHQYEIPKDQYDCSSLLVTPAVDIIKNNCSKTFVYMADVLGHAIIVYDLEKDNSWKISNRYMYPYPHNGKYTINDNSFYLMDGILGLSLSPQRSDGDRVLYFHSLASVYESYVETAVIKNKILFESNPEALPEQFYVFPGKRRSQSTAQVIDEDGIAYFPLLEQDEIACWNINTDYNERNMGRIEENQELLQFPSGIKLVKNPNGKRELWVSSNRLQLVYNNLMNPNETNFRIMTISLDQVLDKTICPDRKTPPWHFFDWIRRVIG